MAKAKDEIEQSVKERFARIARAPSSETVLSVGPASAKKLGYDAKEVDAFPAAVAESFAGVGNPFALRPLEVGAAVLDLGCGAGFDALLAASRVGPRGRVVGVDMTPEMIEKARRNARLVGARNAVFHVGKAGQLPVDSGSIDVVVTNGVFNLCVDKQSVLKEMWRVLKPGGRLQMADILLEPHITPDELASKGEWSD